MTKIQTDESGRRYVERPGGGRVYMPAPPQTDAERAKVKREAERIARHIEMTHRSLQHTINPDDTEEPTE